MLDKTPRRADTILDISHGKDVVQEDGSVLGTCNEDWRRDDFYENTVKIPSSQDTLAPRPRRRQACLPCLFCSNSPGSGRGGHSTSQDGSGEREGGGRGDLSLPLVSPWTQTSAGWKQAVLDASASFACSAFSESSAVSAFENAETSRFSLSPNASEASMTPGQLSDPTHQPANFVSPQAVKLRYLTNCAQTCVFDQLGRSTAGGAQGV